MICVDCNAAHMKTLVRFLQDRIFRKIYFVYERYYIVCVTRLYGAHYLAKSKHSMYTLLVMLQDYMLM